MRVWGGQLGQVTASWGCASAKKGLVGGLERSILGHVRT